MGLVSDLTPDDLVLCLISGGGSALLPLPFDGLTLENKQEVNKALLRSGATIREMNCVRRHLSAIKGGRLAAACQPARVVTLLISDVPGDELINIASGPTVPDPTTCADALEILDRYGIKPAPAVLEVLTSGRGETIKPGDERLLQAEVRMTATPQMALEAAASMALPRISLAMPSRGRPGMSVRSWRALRCKRRGGPSLSPRHACSCLAARPR
jgi:hydroxypyruvate reductase